MTEPRVNDARAKTLRAQVRAEERPCHICGQPINYQAHHHAPDSFQLDHLWQVALGGPLYDYENAGSAHRKCNRNRSDTIDHITIATAARYGVTITRPGAQPTPIGQPPCSPDGQPCAACNGTHNPTPGTTFVTSRNWWSDDDTLADPGACPPSTPHEGPSPGIGINLEGSNVSA